MTAQIPEMLIFEGKEHSMCTNPLEVYRDLGGVLLEFSFTCTALWRGYVGTWEVHRHYDLSSIAGEVHGADKRT